mmetsp:Transcript_15441/g.43870  ORF Transcript_15441/g.43870 Transcript_15441/m.43870 type:complete len:186 (+) Transcript_15441:465-1022(+)
MCHPAAHWLCVPCCACCILLALLWASHAATPSEATTAPSATFPPAGAQREPYDCLANFTDWENAWSEGQQSWCCDHYDRGCAARRASLFDCNDRLDQWEDSWSLDKKVWCCRHRKKGCDHHSATNPDAFECRLDDVGAAGWSDEKRAWCCPNAGAGCPATTAQVSTTTQVPETGNDAEPSTAPSG